LFRNYNNDEKLRTNTGTYYYYYSAFGPVCAGTRAQSGNRNGPGTLHPG